MFETFSWSVPKFKDDAVNDRFTGTRRRTPESNE